MGELRFAPFALGIGDAAVTNRFALWCGVGAFTTANNLVSTLLQSQGISPVAHPLGAAVVATSGLVSSLLLWLVFMPPARYQAWVIRRARAWLLRSPRRPSR